MGSWCCRVFLLAERNGLDELASRMADGFRGDRVRLSPGTVVGMVLGAVALAAAIWFLSRLAAGNDRRSVSNSPGKLFLSLCRAHGLTCKDTWLLWRLARWQQLDDAARLFLEPEHFDFAGLSPPLVARQQRLKSLRDRLFADIAVPETPRATATDELGPDLAIALAGAPAAPAEAAPSC